MAQRPAIATLEYVLSQIDEKSEGQKPTHLSFLEMCWNALLFGNWDKHKDARSDVVTKKTYRSQKNLRIEVVFHSHRLEVQAVGGTALVVLLVLLVSVGGLIIGGAFALAATSMEDGWHFFETTTLISTVMIAVTSLIVSLFNLYERRKGQTRERNSRGP